MLAYVYGVVPISLCRGGGCGVSTANGKGVKIEFDEDDGPITGKDIEQGYGLMPVLNVQVWRIK